MVITRWAWYYCSLAIFVLSFIALFVAKNILGMDPGNWYWIIFGLLILNLWNASPPYKNYAFKMEHLTEGGKQFMVAGGFSEFYEVRLASIDQSLGLELSFFRVELGRERSINTQSIGSVYLSPSSLDAILHKSSGQLYILYAKGNEIHGINHLEKIPPNTTGIILHFAGTTESGMFATIETIRRNSSMWDIMKGVRHELA